MNAGRSRSLPAGSVVTRRATLDQIAGLIVAGLALSAASFAVLTRVDRASGLAVLVSATVIFSLSLAPVFTLTNDAVIGTAPPERAGSASAISETSSEPGRGPGHRHPRQHGSGALSRRHGRRHPGRRTARGGGAILVAQSLGGVTVPLVCTRVRVRMLVFVNAMIPVPGETAGEWWDNTGSSAARTAAARRGGWGTDFDVATYSCMTFRPRSSSKVGARELPEAAVVFREPCRSDRT